MPRKRSGTLIERAAGFFAQVTVDGPSGTPERRFLDLETTDRRLAERKLAKIVRLIDAGEVVAVAKDEAAGEETAAEYAAHWLAGRFASNVVMAPEERNHWEAYALPVIGTTKTMRQVRPADVREVLEGAVLAGRSKEMVRKIRGTMNRIFATAWRDELIPDNPVAKTTVPIDAPEDKRPRTILTDAEITDYLRRGQNAEVKAAAIFSRVLGGMRTAELYRWTWDMVDTHEFAIVKIHRAKQSRGTTGVTQELFVPEPMRPALRAWWQAQGEPTTGPLFPVQRGNTKGDEKAAHNSFARRLRLDLWRARVFRHECIGGEHVCGPLSCCVNFRNDPIHNDTPATKRVDFHGYRRGFVTALAETGTNEQLAMRLSNHADSKVHARYVGQTDAMKRIPALAIPVLPAPQSQHEVAFLLGPSEILNDFSGVDGTRTRGLRRDRPKLDTRNACFSAQKATFDDALEGLVGLLISGVFEGSATGVALRLNELRGRVFRAQSAAWFRRQVAIG